MKRAEKFYWTRQLQARIITSLPDDVLTRFNQSWGRRIIQGNNKNCWTSFQGGGEGENSIIRKSA